MMRLDKRLCILVLFNFSMIIVFCVLLATLIIEPKRTWTYLDLPIFAFVLSSFIYTSFLAITLKMLLWLAPLHTLALAEALYFSLHQPPAPEVGTVLPMGVPAPGMGDCQP